MSAADEKRKQAVMARIRRVKHRLNTEVWLRQAVAPVWVAVTAFVLWRVFVQVWVPVVAGASLLAALAVTRVLVRGKRMTRAMAAVVADRQAGAGGLLLTRLELPVGEWEFDLNQRLKAIHPPAIDVRKPVSMLLLSLLFAAVGMLVPQPRPPLRVSNAAAATRLDQLHDKLEAVAKEEPAETAAKEELERLREELAGGKFDSADWEAADSLDKKLDKEAAEAAAELSRAEQAASALQDAMAEASKAEQTEKEREELERALMALSDGQAADAEQALQQALGQQGQAAEAAAPRSRGSTSLALNGSPPVPNPPRDPASAKLRPDGEQKAGEGKEGQQGKEGQGGKPGTEGLSKQSTVSELRKAMQKRREQLEKSFSQSAGKSAAGSSSKSGQGNQEGRGEGQRSAGKTTLPNGAAHASRSSSGDTGRGPGDADLVFGGQAEMDPDRLAFEALPQGHGGEGEELFGLRAANPKVNRTRPGEASPATGDPAAGDRAAGFNQGPLLPRNRALIEKYFDSK